MAPDCIVEDTAYYKPLDAKVNFSSASEFHSPVTSTCYIGASGFLGSYT
jgi:hypothetical protein